MLLKAFCRSEPKSSDKKSDNRKVISDRKHDSGVSGLAPLADLRCNSTLPEV